MRTRRIRPDQGEEIREIAHRNRLIRCFAAIFLPVLFPADAVPTADVHVPVCQGKAIGENLYCMSFCYFRLFERSSGLL